MKNVECGMWSVEFQSGEAAKSQSPEVLKTGESDEKRKSIGYQDIYLFLLRDCRYAVR